MWSSMSVVFGIWRAALKRGMVSEVEFWGTIEGMRMGKGAGMLGRRRCSPHLTEHVGLGFAGEVDGLEPRFV